VNREEQIVEIKKRYDNLLDNITQIVMMYKSYLLKEEITEEYRKNIIPKIYDFSIVVLKELFLLNLNSDFKRYANEMIESKMKEFKKLIKEMNENISDR